MQKVVGSNPISRFRKAPHSAGFSCFWGQLARTLSQILVPREAVFAGARFLVHDAPRPAYTRTLCAMVSSRLWGLAFVVAAVVAMSSCSRTAPADYDRNLDREVSSTDFKAVPVGATRSAVEQRLGGRGGRRSHPKQYPEPKGLDCFYYTELGGTTFYRLCYRRARLADKAQVVDEESAD